MPVKQQKNKKRKTKASKVTDDSVKIPVGWNTTDEEEVQRRIQRAEEGFKGLKRNP